MAPPILSARPIPPPSGREAERGVALVLALIFSILLYILVAELVVSGRLVRSTGENDALLARMRTQMMYQLVDAEDQLLQDLTGAAAAGGEGGGGALGSALGEGGGNSGGGRPGESSSGGGSSGGGGAGGEGGEGAPEEDPSATCDSSRDAWYEPVGHADNDLTTYVWVEDENRKLNLLSIWSPDEKFSEFSRDRLVRLIDSLREDSDFDVSTGDAQRIAQEIFDWGKRAGTDSMPRARLKSDDEKRRELSIPIHLDELMMVPTVTEELFFDKFFEGKVYLGLESVLTLWTSLRVDPGNPEKLARQRAAAEARGEKPPAAPETPPGGSGEGAAAGGNQAANQGGGDQPPPQPDGLGILVNVNTASRPVLRSLLPPDRFPDRVLDAIIKHRNEVDEEATEKESEQQTTERDDFGDIKLGENVKRKFFATVDELEQVEEFAKLPDPEMKAEIKKALTTKSEVFSIHIATLFKRSEEDRVYVLRRARSIVLRVDDGSEGKIVPLVPFEERKGLRLQPVDLQDEYVDRSFQYSEMDRFAQEDRAWNPFLVDFYLPKHQREQFYLPK
jgi:hypothetical protein